MKAIILTKPPTAYTSPTTPSSLVLNPSFQIPLPSPTETLIRIHAAAITPYELSWPLQPSSPTPRIPCHDISGTVISSPPTSALKPGDRVFGLLPFGGQGGMAEYVSVEAKFLARIPDGLGFAEAASLPRAALTAWQAIKVKAGGEVKEGVRVLVVGATGAVGRIMVQLLKAAVGKGGRVIAVGGGGCESLKEMGAGVVVNYREERDWEAVVRREGLVDVCFDCVGGEALDGCLGCVRNGGKLVTVGSPPPTWGEVREKKVAELDRGVKGAFFIVEESGTILEDIAGLVESSGLKPSVGMVVDGLTEEGVREGWSKGLKGGLAGSVVVKILRSNGSMEETVTQLNSGP
jgi:NADPH2:quinone reductase